MVEEQLKGVQPVLDAARAAVGGIRSDHLSEVRSLRMAPDAIRCAAAAGGGLALRGCLRKLRPASLCACVDYSDY